MAAPQKRNPDIASDVKASGQNLTILNQFCDFLSTLSSDRQYGKSSRDALKAINCLRFIKINAEFISYAFTNRRSRDPKVAQSIYTNLWDFMSDDFAKGVLRDFQYTSFHLNGYQDHQLKKCLEELQLSVAQIEFAIQEVTKRGKEAMLEFTQQFQYDDSVGCLDARLSNANKYIGNLITATTPHLDELFGKLVPEIEMAHLSESQAYDKAFQFFASYIGKSCRFGQSDEEILTWKRVIDYFTETLGYEPPEPLHMLLPTALSVNYNQVENFAIQMGAALECEAIETCLSASNFHPEQLDVDTLTAFNRIFETAQSTFISQAEKKEYRVATFQALSTGVKQAANAEAALEKLLWARQQSMFAEHRSTHWLARLGRTHTVVEIDKMIKTSLKQLNQEKAPIAAQDSSSNAQGFSEASVHLCSTILARESKRLQAQAVIEQRSLFHKVPRQKIVQFSQLQENIQRLLKSSVRPGNAEFRELLQNMTDLLDMGMLNQATSTQLNPITQAWQRLDSGSQSQLDAF